jgi:hypothetical protein
VAGHAQADDHREVEEVDAVGDRPEPLRGAARQQHGAPRTGDERGEDERDAHHAGRVADEVARIHRAGAGGMPPRVGDDQRDAGHGDGSGRHRSERAAVQQHGGGHPGAELREMRQQRGAQCLRPVVRVSQDSAEQPGGHDRQRQGDQAAAVRTEPQREQAGDRQRRIERHLDPERPHRWVEVLDRLLEVILGEEQEDRELVGVDLRPVVEMTQQQERRGERKPVAGQDARGAADRVAGQGRTAARAVQRGRGERAEDQEAREHEEQLDAEAQLADRKVEQALRRPVTVAVAEHPHVQDQDAGGGEAT